LIDVYFFSDEGFIEPPSKKAKTSSSKPTPAASEASARVAAMTAQASTASFLPKGRKILRQLLPQFFVLLLKNL
jgi:hypothetical protein